ncbi:MAG: hypothetical protein FWF91_05060 [Coriobacteriia bacterium]|nr:hypothetical protein [Coriobacteriia bacterium]
MNIKTAKTISFILSLVLVVALIPLFIFAVFSLIPTVMISDSGTGPMVYALMLLSLVICWGIPIFVIVVIVLAWRFRKKDKVHVALILQVIALLVGAAPFLWLFFG